MKLYFEIITDGIPLPSLTTHAQSFAANEQHPAAVFTAPFHNHAAASRQQSVCAS